MGGGVHVVVRTLSIDLDLCVKKTTIGDQLVKNVAASLGVRESWYFGLQFTDRRGLVTWVRPCELVNNDRVRKASPLEFQFLVRYWPLEPTAPFRDLITERLIFEQVRADVEAGNLFCSPQEAAYLAALVLQMEKGDYVSELHERNQLPRNLYLPGTILEQLTLAPGARGQMLQRITRLHRELTGVSPREALKRYLRQVRQTPMYGITYHHVQDKNAKNFWLGVESRGINIYESVDKEDFLSDENRLTPKFRIKWDQMHTVYGVRNKIIIKTYERQNFIFLSKRMRICGDMMALVRGYTTLTKGHRVPPSFQWNFADTGSAGSTHRDTEIGILPSEFICDGDNIIHPIGLPGAVDEGVYESVDSSPLNPEGNSSRNAGLDSSRLMPPVPDWQRNRMSSSDNDLPGSRSASGGDLSGTFRDSGVWDFGSVHPSLGDASDLESVFGSRFWENGLDFGAFSGPESIMGHNSPQPDSLLVPENLMPSTDARTVSENGRAQPSGSERDLWSLRPARGETYASQMSPLRDDVFFGPDPLPSSTLDLDPNPEPLLGAVGGHDEEEGLWASAQDRRQPMSNCPEEIKSRVIMDDFCSALKGFSLSLMMPD